MKKIKLLSIVFFFSLFCFSQNKESDSTKISTQIKVKTDSPTAKKKPIVIGSMNCPYEDFYNYTTLEAEVLTAINNHRLSIGLSTLTVSNHISNICQDKNERSIIANEHDHNSLFASSSYANLACVFNLVPYYPSSGEDATEIIAIGFTNANSVLNSWLTSTNGHKEAIETPHWNHIGISITKNDNTNLNLFTVMFINKGNN